MLNEGWREQYDRMLRSRVRLQCVGSRDSEAGSAEARDSLYHFFQDAYHLKDWLKKDPGIGASRPDAEKAVSDSGVLQICADICNGSKHLMLTGTRTGDRGTAVVSQSVTIYGRGGIEHRWSIDSNGKTYDAHALSDEVVAAWDSWLQDHKLLP